MRTHVCTRCRVEQPIPTHQFVKFDTAVQPLCSDCWTGFRSWFFAGERITRLEPLSDTIIFGGSAPKVPGNNAGKAGSAVASVQD